MIRRSDTVDVVCRNRQELEALVDVDRILASAVTDQAITQTESEKMREAMFAERREGVVACWPMHVTVVDRAKRA